MNTPTLPAGVAALTVSQLTGDIKAALEADFAAVWVVGEVSSLACPTSGHVYFNLKDADAIIKACMWRTVALRHRYAVKDGMEVLVRGRVTVYGKKGEYQIIVEEMQAKGAGAQELALRRLKERLQRQGYFARDRKKPLPPFPRRIALVASPTGAAVRDMLEILGRRWPAAEVWVCPVRVQGDGAADSIATALDRLNGFAGVDVVILGRGGGSTEDLAAFNEEPVAHAIFRSKAPVIAAIGHEVDITVADLVADHRAVTPSEAAEHATPDRDELMADLRRQYHRMNTLLWGKFQVQRRNFQSLAGRRVFQHPLERLRDQERRLDDWEDRLHRAMQVKVQHARKGLEAVAGQLESLSPLNVLARGYSLTRLPGTSQLVRSVGQVAPGDAVEILVPDGRLQARVERTDANPPNV